MTEKANIAVTTISDCSHDHLIKGYPLIELTGNITFAEAVFLCLRGELPDDNQLKMMDVLLTCGIDGGGLGGVQAQAARCIATANREDPMAAVAGSLLAIGGTSGSPAFAAQFIEDAYILIYKQGLSREEVARQVVENTRQQGKRVPGLGHRWYPEGDPRAIRIRECAEKYGFVGDKTLLYDAISAEVTRVTGRPMPPNVDGAFAVAALEMGFSVLATGPLFALTLLPGIMAHVEEEINEPERRSIRRFIDDRLGWEYVGPPRRHLLSDRIKVPRFR